MFLYSESLRISDGILRSATQDITNIRMDDVTWDKATLPIKFGGLGVRLAEEPAVPVYLTLVFSVRALVSNFTTFDPDFVALEALGIWNLEAMSLPSADEFKKIQRSWDTPIVRQAAAKLTPVINIDPVQKARFLAVSAPKYGKWLNALPVPVLATSMHDDSLRILVGLRLGAKICLPHHCRSGRMVDEWGYHGLSCVKSAGSISRHTNLNEI